MAVEEIFPTLLSGATLMLSSSEKMASFAEFSQFIEQKNLTVLNLPAPYWHEWVLDLSQTGTPLPPSLRLVVVGSDKIRLELFIHWQRNIAHSVKCFNAYGLTEATITTLLYQPIAHLNEETAASVPIGRPLANTQIYILDQSLQPTPIGIAGELYIGGASLAQGYLNCPELTAEKLIPNPFSDNIGARLYKTGDLARYLPDGNIEYLGRVDHQVKLRGFRIEVGEIEAVLAQHASVRETVVNLYEDNTGKRLVAYVTANNHQNLALNDAQWISELKNYLKAKLPNYMVPSTFIVMNVLPLIPNGKLDRNALPAPDTQVITSYTAPSTDTEKQLALVWAEVLRRNEPVGIYDNFFELGGDSILSIQIIAKVRAAGLHMNSSDLFQYQTIAELATVVQPLSIMPVIPQGLLTGKVPLTPIQKMFFAKNLPQPWHYNQFVLLEVTTELNTNCLRQALATLLVHHDTLRLRYQKIGNEWQQHYNEPTDEIPFIIEELSEGTEAEQLHKIETKAETHQASLNIKDEPLLRLVLFKFSKGARLLWCIHHLIVDGVSWRILLEDLHTAYQQLSRGKAIKLPPKTTSFKTWAERLSDYAQSEALANEMAYWQTLSHLPMLPLDYPDGINTVASTQNYTVCLGSAETRALLEEAKKKKEEDRKKARVSTTDPDARVMKMPDGGNPASRFIAPSGGKVDSQRGWYVPRSFCRSLNLGAKTFKARRHSHFYHGRATL